MQKMMLALLTGAMITFAAPCAFADGDWGGNVHFLYGMREMGSWDNKNFERDNGELKSQDMFGVEADFGQEWWPVNIWVGYTRSEKRLLVPEIDFDSKATFTEFSAGVRAYLLWFYGGLAVANIGGELRGSLGGIEHDINVNRDVGLLLNAGVYGSLMMVNVGLDVRALTGTDKNDYAQIAIRTGISF